MVLKGLGLSSFAMMYSTTGASYYELPKCASVQECPSGMMHYLMSDEEKKAKNWYDSEYSEHGEDAPRLGGTVAWPYPWPKYVRHPEAGRHSELGLPPLVLPIGSWLRPYEQDQPLTEREKMKQFNDYIYHITAVNTYQRELASWEEMRRPKPRPVMTPMTFPQHYDPDPKPTLRPRRERVRQEPSPHWFNRPVSPEVQERPPLD
jgi:hypothetical protein